MDSAASVCGGPPPTPPPTPTPTPPLVYINAVTLNEGNAGTKVFTFNVTISALPATGATANWIHRATKWRPAS